MVDYNLPFIKDSELSHAIFYIYFMCIIDIDFTHGQLGTMVSAFGHEADISQLRSQWRIHCNPRSS